MVWNNNKNAIPNGPTLSDAKELDNVLEGFLKWENEMLSLRDSEIDQTTTTNPLSFDSNSLPYSTLLQPPSIAPECVEQTDSPRAVKKTNVCPIKLSFPNKKQQKRERPRKNNQKSDDSYATPMNNSTSFSITYQPPSVVILPECSEQENSSRRVKKNKSSNFGKKRGRPTKSDNEGNVDAKTLKKRIYARRYQQKKRAERKKYAELFHSLYHNLKEIDATNPKHNGILKLLEECDPEFKKMNRKN
uniref:BZIP domain-containing protein n=1 Tax=Panagrolaimus sp. PS1159 TaxID=55785 RepID=A0AC35FP06_9BILA